MQMVSKRIICSVCYIKIRVYRISNHNSAYVRSICYVCFDAYILCMCFMCFMHIVFLKAFITPETSLYHLNVKAPKKEAGENNFCVPDR